MSKTKLMISLMKSVLVFISPINEGIFTPPAPNILYIPLQRTCPGFRNDHEESIFVV